MPFETDRQGNTRLRPTVVPGNLSVAYTKRVWQTLGKLPEDLTLCADDSVFGRQLLSSGFKVAHAPKALVYWSRPGPLKTFWSEAFRYGRGDGEASIKTPVAFRLYRKKLLPRFLVPMVTGLREWTRPSFFKACCRAIKSCDFEAFTYLPILVFGSGYHFARGYLIGDKRGEINCQVCRNRLAKYKTTFFT